ncbi:MAG: hypothetical protein NTY47_01875, partial [Candidatus Omnitrophica bacterium]|nr:hypothetical protein [Candidatus Omnitrophota bacterium]
TEETLAEATLYGIMWKKGKPIAIIDGKGYSEGDTYHNKKIVKIEKDKVTLEEEDKLYKLLIKQ